MQRDIKAMVRDFVRSEIPPDVSLEEISDDTVLVNSGILDSLSVLKLVEQLEQDFKIKISEAEITLENIGTINRVESFIRKKASA